jgi:hypothetical protein
MVENNRNPGNRGGNRRNRGPERGGRPKEVNVKAEAYKFLEDDKVTELHDTSMEKIRDAFSQDRTPQNVALIHRISTDLMNIQNEMRDRGLIEYEDDPEEVPEGDPEDEMIADRLENYKEYGVSHPLSGDDNGERQLRQTNKWLEAQRVDDPSATIRKSYKSFDDIWADAKATDNRYNANRKAESDARSAEEAKAQQNKFFEDMAEDHVEGINEKRGQEQLSGKELGDFDLNAQNALRRKLGKSELGSFNDLWKEAQKDNKDFDKEKAKEARKHGIEKEGDVLKAHQESSKEGNYQSFGELYDKANEDNRNVSQIRETSEYKVEKSLEEVIREIDKLQKNLSERVSEYEKRSWVKKLKPSVRLEAARDKSKLDQLPGYKHDLLNGEIKYLDKKKELESKLDIFTSENAEKMSKMDNGDVFSERIRAQYDGIINEIAVTEEKYQEEKEKIITKIEGLFDAEDVDIRGMIEAANTVESEEVDFSGVDSDPLNVDEQLFRKEEEGKLYLDVILQNQMRGLESKLKGNAKKKFAGTTLLDFFKFTTDLEASRRGQKEIDANKPEIDKATEKELEMYKRKILETRIKIRRITEMIKKEKSKGPEKMNLAYINSCTARIKSESVGLKKHAELMSQKVISINQRGRLGRLIERVK